MHVPSMQTIGAGGTEAKYNARAWKCAVDVSSSGTQSSRKSRQLVSVLALSNDVHCKGKHTKVDQKLEVSFGGPNRSAGSDGSLQELQYERILVHMHRLKLSGARQVL